MSDRPHVTVLMTVHNAARYLDASIRSIVAQTWRDWELLIIDDGSTDESARIAGSFDDPRIRPVANSNNAGQTVRLNEGLKLARGELIARQDADDLSLPRRLECQVAAWRQARDIAVLGTQGWLMDAAGKGCGTFDLPLDSESVSWFRFFENPFIHTAVMFRREAALALGGYDPAFRICQDYALWMRMLRDGAGMNLADRLVRYRIHEQSISRTGSETVRCEIRQVIEAEADDISESEADLLSRWRSGLEPGEVPAFMQLRARLMGDHALGRAGALILAKLGRAMLSRSPTLGARLLVRAAAESPRLALGIAKARLFSTNSGHP